MWATALTVLLVLPFAGTTALTIAMWATDHAYTRTNPVVDLSRRTSVDPSPARGRDPWAPPCAPAV